MEQYLRRFSILWFCIAGVALSGAASGITRAEMYQATAPLADRSDAAYTAAFQTAMKTVLIRVTGRRNADEDPGLSRIGQQCAALRAAVSCCARRPSVGVLRRSSHRAVADAERAALVGARAADDFGAVGRANRRAKRQRRDHR